MRIGGMITAAIAASFFSFAAASEVTIDSMILIPIMCIGLPILLGILTEKIVEVLFYDL